jgi:hypothetical protein
MKFRIYTLVDVTETGARRGDGSAYHQQQNYMSLIQTVGIRANPSNFIVDTEKGSIAKLKFGSNYKGTQQYWIVEFEIEYGESSVEFLEQDFNLVPFNTELDETVTFDKNVFLTADLKHTNIFFEKLDK